MADEFITVALEQDPGTLADGAVDRLRQEWEDYDPNDGDLEVVLLEAYSPLAANAAEVASRVPPAVFRYFAEKLLLLPFEDGVEAQADLLVTVDDAAGHVFPQFEVEVDGHSFTTNLQLVIPVGSATGTVGITANEVGRDFNDLTGAIVEPITSLTGIDGLALTGGNTAGGVDAEDETAYLGRMSQRLELQAITLVTTRDFELMALQDYEVARVVAENNGARRLLITLVGYDGQPVSAEGIARVTAVYEKQRGTNVEFSFMAPQYSVIDVTWQVKSYAGYDQPYLLGQVNAMLADYLAPLVWGRRFDSRTGEPYPIADPVIRKNKLIDLIGNIAGVNYVVDLTIAGTNGVLVGDDFVMNGAVALPQPGVMTGTFS